MEEAHVFTIDVAQDARQPGRYRWCVSENTKVRDTSFYSFTTRREAQADADKFVEKLKAIWQPHYLAPLWLDRLSMTTTSPCESVGTRHFSTQSSNVAALIGRS